MGCRVPAESGVTFDRNTQGEVEVGYLLDYSVDANPAINSSARHQFEVEYGVSERWLTAVYGDFRKRPGQKFAYQGFKWENIYQLSHLQKPE